MPGLDRKILRQIDHDGVLTHVKADLRSDFILAPHYNGIISRAGDELWDQLSQQLRAGSYPPDLQDAAVQTVLQQAEVLSARWAA